MTLTGPAGAGAAPTISPWSWSWAGVMSDSLPVVVRALAGAVPAQRPVRPGGVGPLEYPVLPGRQPSEDLRLRSFRAGEPDLQPTPPAAGRQQAGVELVKPDHGRRRRVVVFGEDAVQHVLPVCGERDLEQQAGEAAARRDQRDQAA